MSEHWLIAGASRGIGRELAHQLLARGDRVTASVRNEEARARLMTENVAGKDRLDIVQFDLRDEAAIAEAARKVSAPIDVLVANAGIFGPKRQSSLDMDFSGVLDLFSVNALGPLRLTQAFLPQLRRAKTPRIALMSSVLGSMALEGSSSLGYRAAKAALNKIAQGLAIDLHPDRIAVISLHPGWVRTDMGGEDAPLCVEDSAAGIIKTIDSLTIERSGQFLDYKNQQVEW